MTNLDTPVPPPPPTQKRSRWLFPAVAILAVLVLLVGVGIGASGSEPEVVIETKTVEVEPKDLTEQREAADQRAVELDALQGELDARAAALDEQAAAVKVREDAVTKTEQAIAANTVTDGIWTVGVDIEPGTYRATSVAADCYWAVLVTGSNGSDIVDNGIPGGGSPTVTVKEGQDFETTRCGEWTRQP
jgi:hypothetical protein